MRRVLLCYAAGSAGAFANTLLGHLLFQAQIPFGPPSLYRRLVWGGLWGLLFVLPPVQRMPRVKAGLLVSLAPSAAAVLYFGAANPLAALALNAVWGLCAAALTRDSR